MQADAHGGGARLLLAGLGGIVVKPQGRRAGAAGAVEAAPGKLIIRAQGSGRVGQTAQRHVAAAGADGRRAADVAVMIADHAAGDGVDGVIERVVAEGKGRGRALVDHAQAAVPEEVVVAINRYPAIGGVAVLQIDVDPLEKAIGDVTTGLGRDDLTAAETAIDQGEGRRRVLVAVKMAAVAAGQGPIRETKVGRGHAGQACQRLERVRLVPIVPGVTRLFLNGVIINDMIQIGRRAFRNNRAAIA